MTKYIVETVYTFKEFDEYRDAEIYCGENNIPCDSIYEEEYAENRYEKLMNGIIFASSVLKQRKLSASATSVKYLKSGKMPHTQTSA